MVGGWWLAVGGWRLWLVAVGGWRLAVGGWWPLDAVIKGYPQQKKLGFLQTALGTPHCLNAPSTCCSNSAAQGPAPLKDEITRHLGVRGSRDGTATRVSTTIKTRERGGGSHVPTVQAAPMGPGVGVSHCGPLRPTTAHWDMAGYRRPDVWDAHHLRETGRCCGSSSSEFGLTKYPLQTFCIRTDQFGPFLPFLVGLPRGASVVV